MYIADDDWDFIVSECLDLSETINEFPPNLIFPLKKEILWMLYVIIHTEDQTPASAKPEKRVLKKKQIQKISTLLEKKDWYIIPHMLQILRNNV